MIEISNLRRVAGKQVVSQDGERIGKVADVYESTTEGGGATFATVTTGLFGTSSSFFPLEEAEMRGGEIVVPYSKDFIKHAPRVENDEELTADEEDRLFDYYRRGDQTGEQALGGHRPNSDGTITRSEERLQVGTERVEAARARLRKYVVSETVTRTVPVVHEELRITREPVGAGAVAAQSLSEEDYEVVLTAERPVVHKEVVPIERIRLDTVEVTEQQTVTEQVRREEVELESAEAVEGRPVGGARTQARRPGGVDEPAGTSSHIDMEPRR